MIARMSKVRKKPSRLPKPEKAKTSTARGSGDAEAKQLSVAIIGAGRLGRALAMALDRAAYRVAEIVVRDDANSKRKAQPLARKLKAELLVEGEALSAAIVCVTVPDDSIATVAKELAMTGDWRDKTILHASGALSASVLDPLRARGGRVASAHPLNSFVLTSQPDFRGVPVALEGDVVAVKVARAMALRLKAIPFEILPENKVLYHVFGAFAAPLLVSVLEAAEQVGARAGLENPRRVMHRIVTQTVANLLDVGAADAFSGPLVRGDVDTVRRHLRALQAMPAERTLYCALARYAVERLPGERKTEMLELLR